MGNYQEIVVYTPKTDISVVSWECDVNRRTFNCGALVALKNIKQICPNIKTLSIEKLTEHLNCHEIDVNNNWFGVIYIGM